MKPGYNFTMKFCWSPFQGCSSLERYKMYLDKIVQDKHLNELARKMYEICSIIYLRDRYVTVEIPQDSLRQKMIRVGNLIQYYEVKEATSLVELALWKSKIEEEDGHDRGACRIELPEPAKDLILQYAYDRIP